MTPDERYDIVKSLSQGTKFYYKGEPYLRLPDYVECYGEPANAVNMKTGTMTYFDDNKWIDLVTMIIEE